MVLDLEKEIKANTVNVFVDPVFKKEIDPNTAKYMAGYNGKTYYFCSVCSKKLFMENPERYVES
ncbi:YHS domain-containing protein [Methanobacterium sp.]|uniref:YHS domain-containing protein n=1 Tax=Methanobacterium sp. TaxID=2164 RepID=UPI003C74C9BF